MAVLPDEGDDLAGDISAAFDQVENDAPVEAAPPPQESEPSARARDDQGRFARDQERQEQERQAKTPDETTAPAQESATPAGPPPGWSPTAKAAWAEGTIPAPVIEAIQKREAEINKGFAKLQEYKGLDAYAEMARNSGTTIQTALENYIRAEQRLEKDPRGGILWLCQRYGVDPSQLAGRPQVVPQAAPQQDGQPAALTPDVLAPYIQPLLQSQLAPIQQKLASWEQQQQSQQQRVVGDVIERFANDPANQYFENVEAKVIDFLRLPDIQAIPDLNQRLTEAYQRACWSDPEIRGLLIKEQSTKEAADRAAKAKASASQARAAGRSITSTPSASPPPARADHEDLRAFIAEQFEGARA
ncbi:MAG: hypothetical protein RL328_2619 [Acidobacteriota bacterium]|jgi:hypothetical protein